MVASLWALTAALAFRNVTDVDLGIHAAGGRWIAAHGAVPTLDPFTYTVSENAYLAYHWLYQLLFHGVVSTAGIPGTVIARWIVLMTTALLMADVLRIRRCRPAATAIVGFAALVAFEWSIDMSPQLATVLLAAATIHVLERHRAGMHARLWLLPLIQVVWINTHLFVLGFAIMGIYGVAEVIRRRTVRTALAGWFLACVPALLLNPYGVDAIVHPLVLASRLGADNPFAAYIIELKPPWVAFPNAGMTGTYACFLFLLALGALGLVLQLRRRRFEDAGMLIVFGALSLSATRNVPIYALVAAPALCTALDLLFERLPPWLGSVRAQRTISWAMTGVVVLTALRVVSGAYYQSQNSPVRFGMELCSSCISLRVADWMAAHPEIEGPGFNQLNNGSTLIWRDPQRKVFIDGRNEVTGETFLAHYLQALDPATWPKIDRQYEFEYAVLAHNEGHLLVHALWRDPAWRRVYLDSASSVMVRTDGANGSFPPATAPEPVDDDERDATLAAAEPDLSIIARVARWLFGRNDRSDEPLELGALLLAAGELDAAERPLLEAARLDPERERTHRYLARLYDETKRMRGAVRSQRRADAIAEAGIGF